MRIEVEVPSSKSISNRLLMLQDYFGDLLTISNLSTAEDCLLLQNCLTKIKQNPCGESIFVDNCGTAFRFLCAYLSLKKGTWILDGNQRLRQRPIEPLIDTLRQAGGKIDFIDKKGFAPLKIIGNNWNTNVFHINSSQSSQFVSAILLSLPLNGRDVKIFFQKNSPSMQYIVLTVNLMKKLGMNVELSEEMIIYRHSQPTVPQYIFVEADWSSAAFWYQFLVLNETYNEVYIKNLQQSQWQADAIISHWMKIFGIETIFNKNGAIIQKKENIVPKKIEIDCCNNPDLVPILTTICVGKQIEGVFFNVKNLQYKESDRIRVLQKELSYFSDLQVIGENFIIKPKNNKFPQHHFFHSHEDHRIAMTLALLCSQIKNIEIDNEICVKKSYPEFWNYFAKIQ